MKLVQEIRKNDLLSSNWGIYELSKAEANKYGNKFALSQGIFSDFGIKEFGADKLLSRLRNDLYEGFFETQKEAYMQVKLVEMKCKIDKLEYAAKDLIEATKIKTPKWF